jgi:hypothetical protein
LNDAGYSSETDQWLAYAKKDVEQFLLNRQTYPPMGSPAISVVSQNVEGAFPEGIEYLNYSGLAFIPFMIASRLNGGEDYFQDANFKKLMEWSYNLQLPDGSAPQINSTGYYAYPINSLAASVIAGGSKYLGQLKKFVGNSFGAVDLPVESFALVNRSTAADPVIFPAIINEAAQGEVIMRNDPSSPTRYVLMTAKNGPARYAAELHQYADAGSFLFQADGKMLVRHPGYAGYSASQDLERAKAHNTVCPIVNNAVTDDAPNRDVASPPCADASFTKSKSTVDFSYTALTMEVYGSKAVNGVSDGLSLLMTASSLPYDYGNSLHVTWKNNGTKYGTCDRKFLMVNNSYLIARDDVTRTNSDMQYAVSYIHGNNGNNTTSAAGLTNGFATAANDERTWSTEAMSPVLRANTAALGGKIGAYSNAEAGIHQSPDAVLNPGASRATYYHAALRTSCGFTNNYGQILSILESDANTASKSAVTTKRTTDTDQFISFTVDGRGKNYGRYDLIVSQKQPARIRLTNTGLPIPIETDASFLVVSYGTDVNDTTQIKIFSNGATYVRSGSYVYMPTQTGEAQTSFIATDAAPTQVHQAPPVPNRYTLGQNFPNPFNPSTTIQFGLPVESSVNLQIINILGQVVAKLVDGVEPAGFKSIVWNAGVSSGIYFYRLEAISVTDPTKRFVQIRKLTLMK